MNRIELATHLAERNKASPTYLIAQTLLLSDLQAPALVPFATGEYGPWRKGVDQADRLMETGGKLTYAGPGWIGNRWRDIVCRRMSTAYKIEIDGIGLFSVSSNVQRIAQIERSISCTNEMLVDAALGPPLMLALALQGKYSLHASAAIVGQKAIAFVAESGYGKSTLARYLGANQRTYGQRIGDDILPLMLAQESLLALPHFPQLKLPIDQQPSLHTPAEIPLHTIYVLDKEESQGENKVELRPLTQAAAAMALVQHTVAARLFDQQLLTQHLTFCAAAVNRIKVRRLSYPRSFEILPAVLEALRADLS